MKKQKCLLAILLALVLLLTAGCGASAPHGNPYTPSRTPSANYAPPATYAPTQPAPESNPSVTSVPGAGTEEYLVGTESAFQDTRTNPLSTFSADVDTASYSNMRRLLNQGQLPEGLRIEELVNYFDYGYPAPEPGSEVPFSVSAEVAACPWDSAHLLAMIGIQGEALTHTRRIANNIVFLLDVSGSMADENKLPLLKQSLKLMLPKLNKNDVISIVTYASGSEVAADSIRGSETGKLSRIIDRLNAGGSTAGADGLRLAYDLAEKNYIESGNNRVILATDGDFNVGTSSVDGLTELITRERGSGVSISVLGFGMGNLKDDTMKTIAGNGNGNYAYIDTLQEAQKVLVDDFNSTMFTIAKDVKLQVEFNPATVASYRLIGYDTRRLDNADFNNDQKDAGDIGSGHSVTAFYELIPAAKLKYSQTDAAASDDYMTVQIRYKAPDGDVSQLTECVVGSDAYSGSPSVNFLFASAVAEFGLIATNSEYQGNSSLSDVIARATDGLGADEYGLRAEFLDLVREYGEIIG